jgi:hypothetical protein
VVYWNWINFFQLIFFIKKAQIWDFLSFWAFFTKFCMAKYLPSDWPKTNKIRQNFFIRHFHWFLEEIAKVFQTTLKTLIFYLKLDWTINPHSPKQVNPNWIFKHSNIQIIIKTSYSKSTSRVYTKLTFKCFRRFSS